MVAFNFNPTFADKILAGKKQSTIRKTLRCKVGDKMQLYIGQRTKNCRKLAEVICVGTAKIQIGGKDLWKIVGEREGQYYIKAALHEQEGFPNVASLVQFFDDQYGLPFVGYIHTWEPPTDKTSMEK